MDATELLTQQHRKLEALFKAALSAQQPDPRRRTHTEAGDELTTHMTSEEQVFYPIVKARATHDILMESLEEHLSLKRLLADLLALEPADETWEAKVKVLYEPAEHHHKEEEEHLFPHVRKTFADDDLDDLAQQILACQQSLQGQGAPREAVLDQTEAAAPLK